MAMYVDGDLVAAHGVEGNGNYGFAQAYSGYWRVGGDNLGAWPEQPSSVMFQGAIDEVAVYPTALTASQVENACTGPNSYACVVKADGAGPYWRLGDSVASTTADDSSQNGLDGTYSGGVVRGQAGAVSGDNATLFDGVDGTVGSNDVIGDPQNFSVEAWFNTTTTNGGKVVGFGNTQSGNGSQYDRHIYMDDDGHVIFGVWEGFPAIVQSPDTYNDGQWHQVVGTISAADGMRLYVDGTQVDSHAVESDGSYGFAEGRDGYWRVGGDNLGGWPNQPTSFYLDGLIDEVAIYPIPLSAAQVQAHHDAAT
jgi:hypothetical protein